MKFNDLMRAACYGGNAVVLCNKYKNKMIVIKNFFKVDQ